MHQYPQLRVSRCLSLGHCWVTNGHPRQNVMRTLAMILSSEQRTALRTVSQHGSERVDLNKQESGADRSSLVVQTRYFSSSSAEFDSTVSASARSPPTSANSCRGGACGRRGRPSAEEVRSANDRAREIQQPDRIQTEPQDTGDVGPAGQPAENYAGRPENPCDVRTNGERRAPR